MINKLVKNSMFFLIISLLFSISLVSIKRVSADSGWDFDYDSGSSWSSSWDSDYDSDWSWDSTSSSSYDSSDGGSSRPLSDGEKIIYVLFVVGAVIVVLILVTIEIVNFIKHNRKNSKEFFSDPIYKNVRLGDLVVQNKNYNGDEYREALSFKPLPDDIPVDREEFQEYAYETFVKIQEAWMNFDYDNLRKYVSDEIYNTYHMQLETLKEKHQKNIMTDFRLMGSIIRNYKHTNDKDIIDVFLSVRFHDYVIDENGNAVRGYKNTYYQVSYNLSFERYAYSEKRICPNCGGVIEDNTSNVCSYCRTILKYHNSEFVMCKKEKVSQKIVRK